MDTEDEHTTGEDGDLEKGGDKLKCFHLLNALSDLLMLPKDMLMDRSVRTEVYAHIKLSVIILKCHLTRLFC